MPDFQNDELAGLKLSNITAEHARVSPPNLLEVLSGPSPGSVQSRLCLLDVTLRLLGKFSEMYKGLDGFVELYTPVLEVIQAISLQNFPCDLQVCYFYRCNHYHTKFFPGSSFQPERDLITAAEVCEAVTLSFASSDT
jgi:hypothetical protein